MLWGPVVTVLAQNTRLKSFSPIFWDGASAARHDISTRYAIERIFLPSHGDVASATCHGIGMTHGIGARFAIGIFFNNPRYCECRWSWYWRKICDWIFFQQSWEMLRLLLVTIFARDMRLNFFLNHPERCCDCRESRYWREICDWKKVFD